MCNAQGQFMDSTSPKFFSFSTRTDVPGYQLPKSNAAKPQMTDQPMKKSQSPQSDLRKEKHLQAPELLKLLARWEAPQPGSRFPVRKKRLTPRGSHPPLITLLPDSWAKVLPICTTLLCAA